MRSRAQLKSEAKQALAGNWTSAVIFCLLYTLVSGIVSFFTLGLGALLVTGPLLYGLFKYFARLSQGETVEAELLFVGFKQFGRTLATFLLVAIWSFLWVLPFIVGIFIVLIVTGGAALVGGLSSSTSAAAWATILGIIVVALPLILALLIGIIWASLNAQARYSQVWFLLHSEPNLSATQVIKKSVSLMQGHKIEYIILNLSFIGWAFLAFLTLGLGWLWLMPYMLTTYARYFAALVAPAPAQKKIAPAAKKPRGKK